MRSSNLKGVRYLRFQRIKDKNYSGPVWSEIRRLTYWTNLPDGYRLAFFTRNLFGHYYLLPPFFSFTGEGVVG